MLDEPEAMGSPDDSSPRSYKADPEDDASGTPGDVSLSSQQKRRRVTRACDECRRKKIKCDGKQPCTHCTVYSYDCTYDQPSNRRRGPGPQLVEALESRLRRAEALLKMVLPDLDMDDPSIDAILQQQQAGSPASASDLPSRKRPQSQPQKPSNEPDLGSMVGATGQLDLDERGNWDYHGHASGLSFLRRLRQQYGDDILGPERLMNNKATHFMRTRPPPETIDSPRSFKSFADSSYETSIGSVELPAKSKALELCSDALDDAGIILCIVHQPTFYRSLERIYSRTSETYENQDHTFLPLLYVVLAVGCIFAKDEESELQREGYDTMTSQGFKYFWAARQLMDITDCRDLVSLQAVVFMILFLQCSANLSTCYAYIGVALRSALRMGLHRSFKDNFTPIEAEVRKRAFWVIRKMDVTVAAMLGLPQTLSDDDIDQEFPLEVDDEFITDTCILPMPKDRTSSVAAANANYQLAKIVSDIMRNIYPIKGLQKKDQDPSRTYSISYATIRRIEGDLQAWNQGLPSLFRPGGDAEPHVLRIRNLLRMAFAHAQMMLYRPFLHYVSSKVQSSSVDQRAYACSAACVSVSRNVIHITAEMKKSGLFVGSYWFSMYTTFFAILSLIYYALENPESTTSQDVFRDAKEGKDTLASLAKRSMAADRCTTLFAGLFEHLDKAMSKIASGQKLPGRKRDAPGSVPSQAARSHPDISNVSTPPAPRRASTFPDLTQVVPAARHANIAPRPNKSNWGQGSVAGQNPLATPGSNPFNHAMTPEPVNGGMMPGRPMQDPFGGQQQAYLPSQLRNLPQPTNISDLSAMMFPSADPFAYPNQPMLTLEQNYNHHDQQNNPFVQTMHQDEMVPASTAGMQSAPMDDQVDVQLFGPLPPYLMQQSHANSSPAMTGFSSPATTMSSMSQRQAPMVNGDNMFNQQMVDDLFGQNDWQHRY